MITITWTNINLYATINKYECYFIHVFIYLFKNTSLSPLQWLIHLMCAWSLDQHNHCRGAQWNVTDAQWQCVTTLNYRVDRRLAVYTKGESSCIEYISIYHCMMTTRIAFNLTSAFPHSEVNHISAVLKTIIGKIDLCFSLLVRSLLTRNLMSWIPWNNVFIT